MILVLRPSASSVVVGTYNQFIFGLDFPLRLIFSLLLETLVNSRLRQLGLTLAVARENITVNYKKLILYIRKLMITVRGRPIVP